MVKKLVDLRDVELSDPVEKYLNQKSKSTASTYRGNLKRFRKFYGKPITEFIDKIEAQMIENRGLPASERKRYFDESINEFIKWMQDLGYANNPIRGSLTALQNLFKYYQVQVTYQFVTVPPPISKKTNHKHKWKLEEIKEFVDKAKSYRDKAIILTMLQSGIAVNEICGLNYGDVERQLKSGELPILIDVVRDKNANPFKTLIGADTVKYLKLYLETRGELKKNDPLFTKHGSSVRITVESIQRRFRELASEVFGYSEDEMNPYRPHSMRSTFRSRLTGKTNGDLIKFWMGDVLGPKAGAYLNLPDEEHKELYMAVEGRLSIETTSKDVLEGRVGEGEPSNLLRAYQERLAQLEMGNESLNRMVNSLVEQMEAMRLGRNAALEERIKALEGYIEAMQVEIYGPPEEAEKAKVSKQRA